MLTINFTSASVTNTIVNSIVRAIQYSTTDTAVANNSPITLNYDFINNAHSLSSAQTANVTIRYDGPTIDMGSYSTASFTVGGTPQTINSLITINDQSLNTINNYGNTTLTIERSSGNIASDSYSLPSSIGGNSIAIAGGTNVLSFNGTNIGTFIVAGGMLTINFTGASVTNTIVNSIVRAIQYTTTDTAVVNNAINLVYSFNNNISGVASVAASLNLEAQYSAPLIDAPTTVSYNNLLGEYVFGGANAVLSQVNGYLGMESITLSVTNGTITLNPLVTTGTLGNAALGSCVHIAGGSSGSATVTLYGTIAQLNTALNNLIYAPTSGSYTDTLTVAGNNINSLGNVTSSVVTDTVSIIATTTTIHGLNTVSPNMFTAGGAAVLVDPQIMISDSKVDVGNQYGSNYSGYTITVSNASGYNSYDVLGLNLTTFNNRTTAYLSGNNILYDGTTVGNYSYNSGTGILTINFNSGIPRGHIINEVLQNITYQNTNSASPPTSVTLKYIVSDGVVTAGVATGYTTINNSSIPTTVNQIISNTATDPIIMMPPGTDLAIPASLGSYVFGGVNPVQIAGSSAYVQVTLQVSNGTVTLNPSVTNSSAAALGGTGIYITSGSSVSSTVTFYGTLAKVNAALTGLQYTRVVGTSDQLTVIANDTDSEGTIFLSPKVISSIAIITLPNSFIGPELVSPNTYIQGGDAVLVNPIIMLRDVIHNIAGNQVSSLTNYSGATITVARAGGANSSDVFSLAGLNQIDYKNLAYISSGTPTNGVITAGNSEIATFSYAAGTLTINITRIIYGNSMNDILAGISYANTSSAPPASVNIQYTFSDRYNPYDTINTYTTLNIKSANMAPVIVAPSTISVNENSNLVFSGSDLLTVTASAGSYQISATLIANHGTLNLGSITEVTITAGANGTNTITLLGTADQINTAIANLIYVPDLNYAGSDSINIVANGQGTTLNGGALTASQSIAITVAPATSAATIQPTINNLNATSTNTYIAGSTTAVVIDNNTIISDSYLNLLNNGLSNYSNSVLMVARSGGASTQDVFSFAPMHNVTVNGNTLIANGNVIANITNIYGQLQIQFVNTGTIPTQVLVNEVVQAIQYSNNNSSPPAVVSLTYTFNDGTGQIIASNTATITVATTIANTEPPINIVPSTQLIIENTPNQTTGTVTFNSTNNNVISIQDNVNTTDTVTLAVSHGVLAFNPTALAGLTSYTNKGSIITATGTIGSLNAVLNGLTYTSNPGYTGKDILQLITSNDNATDNLSTASNINITVSQVVNVVPVNIMPPTITYLSNTATQTFNGTISIEDVDSNAAATVTLTTNYGTLAFNSTTLSSLGSNLTSVNNNSNTVTATGSVADLNTILNGLVYTPNPNYVGVDVITLVTNDNNINSVNGALSATSSLVVNVGVAVPVMPIIIMPQGTNLIVDYTSHSEWSQTFIFGGANAIQIAGGSGTEIVTLTVSSGMLQFGSTTGLSSVTDNNSTIRAIGTTSAINAALKNLNYIFASSIDQVTVTVADYFGTAITSPKVSSTIAIVVKYSSVIGLNPVSDNSYVEGGPAILIDPTVMAWHAPFNTYGNQYDNQDYSATKFTVSRVGGANAEDVFNLSLGTFNNGTTAYLSGNNILSNNVIVGGYSSSGGLLTININDGTSSHILDEVLQSITYQNISTAPPASVNIQYTYDDYFSKASVTNFYTTINITAANTTPTINAPAIISVNENTNLVFSGSNLLSVTESAGSYMLSATLTVNHGVIDLVTAAPSSGATITAGANGTNTITLLGTAVQINAAIANLIYVPDLNYVGSDSINIVLNGQGTTLTGGALTASQSIAITVAPATSAASIQPTIDNLNPTSINTYIAGSSTAVVIDNDTVISDSYLNLLNHGLSNYSNSVFRVARTGGASHQDVFSFAPMDNVTVSGNTLLANGNIIANVTNDYGQLQIQFVNNGTIPTQALVNEVVQAIQYSNTNSVPSSTINLTYTFNDGTGQAIASNTATINVNTTTVNTAPINIVPSTQVIVENTLNQTTGTVIFNSNNSNVISIQDSTSTTDTITLAVNHGVLAFNGAALTAAVLSGAITNYSNNDSIITATGTIASLNAVLNGLTYNSNAGYTGTDMLQLITSNDNLSGNLSTANNIDITVSRVVNVAPANTVPADFSYVDNTKVLSVTGVSIADPDSNSATITLTVNNGVLNIGSNNISITGNGTGTITATGLVAHLNTALAALTYTPNSGYIGTDTITLVTNDNNTASVNGPLSVTNTINLAVGISEIMPSITAPTNVSFNANLSDMYTFSNNAISVSNLDPISSPYQLVTVFVGNGTITLNPAVTTSLAAASAGTGICVTLSLIDPDSPFDTYPHVLTFWGTITNINNALNGLVYTRTHGYVDQMTIVTQDINSTNTAVTSPKVYQTIFIDQQISSFTNLNAVSANNYIDGGAAIAINSSIMISDAIIGAGSFANTTLKIARTGAVADPSDVFSFGLDTNNTGSPIAWVNTSTNILYTGDSTIVGTYDTTIPGQLTISFNANAINSIVNYIMQNILYSNSSYAPPTSVNLTYTFNDGYGGAGIATGNTTVNITAVNNAPTITGPNAVSFNENNGFMFSGTNIIAVHDDSNIGIEQVMLSVSHGTLNLANGSGVTIISGNNGTNAITLTGTIAQLNTALNNLIYIPNLNYVGTTDTLLININDQGNTGTGGTLNTSKNIAITVGSNVITAAQPVITDLDAEAINTYYKGQAAVIIDNNVTISNSTLDILNNNLGNYSNTQLTIMRSGGAVTEDVFSFAAMPDVTVSGAHTLSAGGYVIANFTNANGQLQIQFVNTGLIPNGALVDEIMQAIQYQNTNATPPTSVTLSYEFDNASGGANSSVTANIIVNIDPPYINIPNTPAMFTENTAPIIIAAGILITDINGLDDLNNNLGDYNGSQLIVNRANGANLQDMFYFGTMQNVTVDSLNSKLLVGGDIIANFNSGNGQLAINFLSNGTIATTALINEVAQSIQYSNTSLLPPTNVTLEYVFSDGGAFGGILTATATADVSITGVDQPAQIAMLRHDFVGPNNHIGVSAVVDLNQDGTPDIIHYDAVTQNLVWYSNDGSGLFTSPTNSIIASNITNINQIVTADVTNDGKTDLFIINGANSGLLINNGSEIFTMFTPITDNIVTIAAGVMQSSLNNMNLVYVTQNAGNSQLNFASSNNDGTFNIDANPIASFTGSVTPGSMQLTDINQDNKLDILLTQGQSTSWYQNDGAGVFTPHTIQSAYHTAGVATGDMFNSGFIDIVTIDQNDPIIRMFVNTGDNLTFTSTVVANDPGIFGATNINITDINQDGNPDILVMGTQGTEAGHVVEFLNNGQGSFTKYVDPNQVTDTPANQNLTTANLNPSQQQMAIITGEDWLTSLLINSQAIGTTGNDVIDAGAAPIGTVNQISGNGGIDQFVFKHNYGNAIITDFDDGNNVINLSAFGLVGINDPNLHITVSGNHTNIIITNEVSIVLENDINMLNNNNFNF